MNYQQRVEILAANDALTVVETGLKSAGRLLGAMNAAGLSEASIERIQDAAALADATRTPIRATLRRLEQILRVEK